ncbi:MAG TPA: response regulator transcription factor [Rhizorhapis sp.]
MHSVLLSDDHPLLLRGLQDILGAAPDFQIIGATTSGAKALSLVRNRKPDIALLDVAMPDVGGLDILRSVHEYGLPVKVVFLTATLTGREIADAMAMGIWGLLLKEYAPEALLDCLRQVISGEKWLPAELVSKAAHAPQDSGERKIELLTRREREITELICGGLSNRCIADTLGTSEGTITVHLHNIYQKLEITNRTALAALHVQYRIVRDG